MRTGRGPVLVACTACNAQPGQPCTQPTNTTREMVSWYHRVREDAAERELVQYMVEFTDGGGGEVNQYFAEWAEAREHAGEVEGILYEVRKLDDFTKERD